jgi:hypothetical protein
LRVNVRRLLAAAALWASVTILGPPARADALYLLHGEVLPTIRLDGTGMSTLDAAGSLLVAGGGRLDFVAYGRHFELELTTNRSLHGGRSAAAEPAGLQHVYLKGGLAGAQGSWARLAVGSDGVRGAIWDGSELYVLEPAKDVESIHVGAAAGDEGLLVYRASDALLADTAIGCGNSGAPADGTLAAAMKTVLAELGTASKAGATREIDVALIADAEFAATQGPQAEQAMLDRLNIADGIFSSQLGLQLVAAELQVFRAEPDPFSETRDDLLLEQLVAHARSRPELDAMAVSYLFTGREVCGEGLFGCSVNGRSTAKLCGAEAVALGEPLGSVYVDALLLAHELGHNLGAGHDGLAPCEATPTTGYLMSQFTDKQRETISACALAQMSVTLASSSCVRTLGSQPPTELPPSVAPPASGPGGGSGGGSGGGGGHPGGSILLFAGLAALARRGRIVRI